LSAGDGRARASRLRTTPFSLSVAALVIVSLHLVAESRLSAAAAQRPNIVLIMSDDMGYSDIGCYGGEIQTPVLNSLASGGLRFTQFYNTGRCCPTRASLLTGLYPHQAGVGWMLQDQGLPGYTTGLNRNCLTIAQVMRSAGYRTYMTGKWHVTAKTRPESDQDQANWPLQRGYDRFFGTIHGAGSFYDPNSLTRDNQLIAPEDPETFFYTDAISQNAARYVREHAGQHGDKPFFMYVAYTAAHWPMHARPHNIARYQGVYDGGWDAIRQQRYERMQQMGLIDPAWELTPRDAKSPAWEEAPDKQWEIRLMEVYAAMVDCMDQGIGQIVTALQDTDQFDNTLVFFLQDNGGCAEGMGRGDQVTYRDSEPETLKPMAPGELQYDMIPKRTRDGRAVRQGRGVMAGPADTYLGYGLSWANASNTPFREYKHWVHEGGISTPLIAHWPAGIATQRRGQLESQPGHLIDLMATCVDVGGAQYPTVCDGQPITPLEGASLRPAFSGQSLNRQGPIFWEHEGNCAVRDGRWKLVRKGNMGSGETTPWELYDMTADRSEMHDLAEQHPERVAQMSAQWEAWAEHAQVTPWPWGRERRKAKRSAKKRFELKAGDALEQAAAPDITDRPFRIQAAISEPGEGVIVAQGGVSLGYTLYISDGVPFFATRHKGQLTIIGGDQSLPAGSATIDVALAQDGRVTLQVDGATVASGQTPGTIQIPVDGLTVGSDGGDPVGQYAGPNAFGGKIDQVRIELDK
jgi:arylsulfatase